MTKCRRRQNQPHGELANTADAQAIDPTDLTDVT